MVRMMTGGIVDRFLSFAKAEMIQKNETEIRCPCRRCKLSSLMDPDSFTIKGHLLMRGFMDGYGWEGDEDDYEVVHGISPPWLYLKPNPRPRAQTSPRKMSHGYWLAKWTNASSLPTHQSPVVLSCGEAKGTSLEWMEPPTSKTSTSTTTQRLKMTTTMMQYRTNQEEAGPPYLKAFARSRE